MVEVRKNQGRDRKITVGEPRFAKKWQSSRKSGQRSDWRERLSILVSDRTVESDGSDPLRGVEPTN